MYMTHRSESWKIAIKIAVWIVGAYLFCCIFLNWHFYNNDLNNRTTYPCNNGPFFFMEECAHGVYLYTPFCGENPVKIADHNWYYSTTDHRNHRGTTHDRINPQYKGGCPRISYATWH